jgi:hypothetical protein
MYSNRKGLILGFHGCDRELRDEIVSKKGIVLKHSDNAYDWLGNGIYFWENNLKRAFEFAKFLNENPLHNKKQKIKEPAVLGAIIDLGYCLDLLDNEYLALLREAYDAMNITEKIHNFPMPKNVPLKENGDLFNSIFRLRSYRIYSSIQQGH